jgi:cytochrome c oxidase subunit II
MGIRSLRQVWLKVSLGIISLLAVGGAALADELIGLPTDKAMHLQAAGSQTKIEAIKFHDQLLLPIITGIVLLVLGLLIWVVIRYNKRANPKAAKFSHNTTIEILWTVIPVILLVIIAFGSFRLLHVFHDMPKPDVVVKATGNQWYWTYDYPELGVTDLESRLLPEAQDIQKAHAAKVQYLLSVDNALVVPVGKVVHVQVTAADVLHAFAMPAFGIKVDAIPGRLNHTWFKADKVGTYYGQCSELCGVEHAYMPIEIKVVTPQAFDAFIIKAGGKTKAMLSAETLAAEQAALLAKATAEAAAAQSSSAASQSTTASSSSATSIVALAPVAK